jgi:hypothetical protein
VTSTYPLRLPASIKAEAERLAAAEGTSLNQLIATAVAEKVAALRTAELFRERKGRTDWAAFERYTARELTRQQCALFDQVAAARAGRPTQ